MRNKKKDIHGKKDLKKRNKICEKVESGQFQKGLFKCWSGKI